jgi:hypothetical protein
VKGEGGGERIYSGEEALPAGERTDPGWGRVFLSLLFFVLFLAVFSERF